MKFKNIVKEEYLKELVYGGFMKTYCVENKANRGIGVSMFQYNKVNEWNSFSATSNRSIKKGSIRQIVQKVANNNGVLEK